MIAFIDKFREDRNPEILVAELLFQKATFYFDSKQFWKASILLRIASALDDNHLEIKKDLEIVMRNLSHKEKHKHQLHNMAGAAKNLHPDLDKLWGYKKGIENLGDNLKSYLYSREVIHNGPLEKPAQSQDKSISSQSLKLKAEETFSKASEVFHSDPKLARKLLLKTLSIYPQHKDARIDLDILDNNQAKRINENLSVDESKQRSAQLFFRQSSDLFEKDPVRAMILLREVLELDPSHQEAKKDLDLLKIKLGIQTKP